MQRGNFFSGSGAVVHEPLVKIESDPRAPANLAEGVEGRERGGHNPLPRPLHFGVKGWGRGRNSLSLLPVCW